MKIFNKILIRYNALFCLLLILAIFIVSCTKKSSSIIEPIDFTYFPLKLKSWIMYDVSHTIIDKVSHPTDSISKYQLKEIIDTIFEDSSGKINYRIERYVRKDSLQPWMIRDVWAQCIDENTAQRVEENIRYVKLKFPVKINKTWNGNMYNSENGKDYKITSLHRPEKINSQSFDSVLTVTQENIDNIVAKFYSIEKFAKHIGLIQKKDERIYEMYPPSYSTNILMRYKRADLLYINIIAHGNH